MTDVAVLTFHRASNYGAVLQAWALQEALGRLGVSAELLDYRSEFLESHYNQGIFSTLISPRRLGIALLRNGYYRDRRRIFHDFIQREVPISTVAYDRESLAQADERYQRFICGSDQVWNYQTAGFDRSYFLDFVSGDPGRRAAYAASFGIESIPEDYQGEYRRLLARFSRITVREDAGRRIVQGLTGQDAEVVLDPTLLIDADGWEGLSRLGSAPQRRYLVVYLLAETKAMLSYARALAAERGLQAIYISQRLFRPRGMTVISDATPYDFIRLLKNADAIVTNSFHGMAFGLNFGLDLHYDLLPEPSRVNSRLITLAERFGLADRRISGMELCPSRDANSLSASLEALGSARRDSWRSLRDLIEGVR